MAMQGSAPAFGLYAHIRSNQRRSVLLVAGLFVLVYAMAFAGSLLFTAFTQPHLPLDAILARAFVDLRIAAPVATILAAAWVWIAWWFNTRIIDAVTGAIPIRREQNQRLYDQLETLCISVGMAMPKLKIIETDAVNAYASGLREDQYTVTVTRGLLNSLEPAEIEAVLAHELTHIRNGDVRLMVVAMLIAGVISFFGEILFRWFTRGPRIATGSNRRSSDSKNGGGAFAAILIAIAIIVAAWLLSQVVRFALSRSREYLADAGAVELTKDPDAMISALLRISGRGELPGAPSGVMEMCIDNPHSGFVDMFATHPAIEDRVERLMRVAGGRMPDWALAGEEIPPPVLDRAFTPETNPPTGPWVRRSD